MESDQGKLFIGGISWETTEEKLKSYFSSFGEVVEAVIMKDRATGRARGFGFVVFADPIVADRVVQDKHSIDGRMVEAKKAVPRDDQQSAGRTNNGNADNTSPSNPSRTKKVFVGGLASSVTENDFKKYFAQFGTVIDVVVMYDHGTHRPRGFGFITYESEESVEKVLQKTFHELNGKMVEVKRAIPKELSTGSVRSNGMGFGAGAGGRGSPYYRGSYSQASGSSPIMPYSPQTDAMYGLSPISDRAMYSPYGVAGHASSRVFKGLINGAYSPGLFGGSSAYAGDIYGPVMPRGSSFGSSYGRPASSDSFDNVYSSVPGRNPWGIGETIDDGFNDSAICNVNWAPSLSGTSDLQRWGTSQTANSVRATRKKRSSNSEGTDGELYFSNSAAYGGENTSHGSSLGDCGLSRSRVGNSLYLGNIYGSFGFGDSTWRTTLADKFRLASARYEGLGSRAYDLPRSHDGTGDDEQAVDDGYSVPERPTYRAL